MRGQAEGVAGDDPPARWAGVGVEMAEGIASLRAVDHLVRAIRAERAGRMLREQREADGSRRLVWEILGATGGTSEDRRMVPDETGRGSG